MSLKKRPAAAWECASEDEKEFSTPSKKNRNGLLDEMKLPDKKFDKNKFHAVNSDKKSEAAAAAAGVRFIKKEKLWCLCLEPDCGEKRFFEYNKLDDKPCPCCGAWPTIMSESEVVNVEKAREAVSNAARLAHLPVKKKPVDDVKEIEEA